MKNGIGIKNEYNSVDKLRGFLEKINLQMF